MRPRLRADVFEIAFQFAHRRLFGDRSVAGHDDIDVKAQNIIAGLDPIFDRARPQNRMAADEQQISRVQDTVGRHMDQYVATGMRRAEMSQHQPLAADHHFHGVVEHRRRRSCDDAVPIEAAAHDLVEESAALAESLPSGLQGHEHARRCFDKFFRASAAGDDLSAFDQLIPEHVIAVGVGVDELADIARGRHRVAHGFEHLRGQR
jgi:hypothetical protein